MDCSNESGKLRSDCLSSAKPFDDLEATNTEWEEMGLTLIPGEHRVKLDLYDDEPTVLCSVPQVPVNTAETLQRQHEAAQRQTQERNIQRQEGA